MILAGDIGGTKTILALFKADSTDTVPKQIHQFKSQDFTSFTQIIKEFIKITKPINIQAACFGIAGPVIDNKCHTTNLPWSISALELEKYLNTNSIYLLNDLETTAYGMLFLKNNEFYTLQRQLTKQTGNKAVIAAGTGLGEAILFHSKNKYYPSASEGGHTDFAPTSPMQDKLLIYLRERYELHVSYEKILSGPGIYMLYQFLQEIYKLTTTLDIASLDNNIDKSALISNYAIKHNDPLCTQTMSLFAQIYGQEAGNLALKALSVGGIYIGGGIAPKILPYLTDGVFLKAFLNKGRFSQLLSNMEIKISLNQNTALTGAMCFAKEKVT